MQAANRCHSTSRRAACRGHLSAACRRVQVLSRHVLGHAVPGANQLPPAAYVQPAAPAAVGRQLRLQATASAEPSVKPYQPPAGGFQLYHISGDGSCMFRAIVQGLQVATTGAPMSLKSETTAALNLRAAVVQELRNRKSEMEPFIVGITDDWEGYLRRMADPGVWGGEPEMVMAVNVVRRPITVYRPVGRSVEPIVTYGEELLKQHPAINLLWSGAHYDLLVPAVGEDGPQSAATAA